MKRTIYAAAALLALVSCQKALETVPTASEDTVTICAPSTVGAGTKVTIGSIDNGIYPVSWSDSECTYLREVYTPAEGDAVVSHYGSGKTFVKNSATTGSFRFTIAANDGAGRYDYVAIYPCDPADCKTSLTHGVRYGGTDSKNRVSYILNHTAAQKPLAGGPDPSTHIMLAKELGKTAQATGLSLAFKPVVAYGKMTVKNFPALAAGETVNKITVSAPAGKVMAGRLYHKIADDTTAPYNATNVTNYVMVDPANITFNTTGFDVWFTTFPFDLAADEVLSVKVETSANTYVKDLKLTKPVSFSCGKVAAFGYDWKKGDETKKLVLALDFTTCPEGWPDGTTYSSKDVSSKEYTYTIDGVAYSFSNTPCPDASSRGTCWGYSAAGDMYFMQVHRYLGLPAIEGYKLTKLSFVMSADTNTGRKAGITSSVVKSTETKTFIPGGEQIVVGTKGEEYSFTLSSTEANTRYYLCCSNKAIGFTSLTLTYEEAK